MRAALSGRLGRVVSGVSLGLVAVTLLACGERGQAPGQATGADVEESTAAEVVGTGRAEAETGTDTAGLEARLVELFGDFGDVRYFDASVDLDGDGRDERVVHVAGPMVCGTGGCNTLVFTPAVDGWRKVAEISVSRPPIQASSRTTNGWRNLLVYVSGGGLGTSYDAELEFDGESYPSNPTVEPAEPAPDLEGVELLIAPFDSFTEGKPITE